MNKITISVPSSVANVSCGFDVLGFCLEKPCDEMTVEIKKNQGVDIQIINEKSIPTNPKDNVCGAVAFAMIKKLNFKYGFKIKIIKNIKPGSGIGSSAASAAGTAFAINQLTGNIFSKLDLVKYAMYGEKIASGAKHADNLSPVIFGGFTLVRSLKPLDIIEPYRLEMGTKLKTKEGSDLYDFWGLDISKEVRKELKKLVNLSLQ